MTATGYPFQMAGGVPVVTAPAEIDTSNAGELRAILFAWQSRGHATVVVDLTGTVFCDSAGLRELVWAHKRAVADGGGLLLVIPAEGVVARIVAVTGLAGIIPRFATVGQAVAQVPAVAARPRRRRPAPEPDGRGCEQCGAAFVPVREHARFCGTECRAAWNREHLGDPAVEASALAWSLAAMSEATGRLPALKVWDQERAFAAIGEAVWWITMVDATLVRHHLGVYDGVMAAHAPAGRRLVVETLAGLRFVRNQIGRGAPLGVAIDTGAVSRRITGWTWQPVPEPVGDGVPPRAQAWELARHRAYQACLVGCTIGESFGRAVTFLTLTGATAASTTGTSQPAPRQPRPL